MDGGKRPVCWMACDIGRVKRTHVGIALVVAHRDTTLNVIARGPLTQKAGTLLGRHERRGQTR